MPRIKPATPEELEKIKDHFEASGYGRISDETAQAQTFVLRRIREGSPLIRRKSDGE